MMAISAVHDHRFLGAFIRTLGFLVVIAQIGAICGLAWAEPVTLNETQRIERGGWQVDGCFGSTLDVEAGVAVVGDPCDEMTSGAAYAFALQPDGVWVQSWHYAKGSGFADDLFGAAVSMDAGRVAIGEPALSGGMHFYQVLAEGALEFLSSYWYPADWDMIPGDGFGSRLAFDDQTVVSGSRWYRRLYIMEERNGSWVEVEQLAAASIFDLDGASILVGDPEDDAEGENAGAVRTLDRNNRGIWRERQEIRPADPTAGQAFGQSVAIDGSRAVIGASGRSNADGALGVAYVFERQGRRAWRQVARLDEAGAAPCPRFRTVALSGDTAVVACRADARPVAVFFRKPDGEWVLVARLVGHDVVADSAFGAAMALDGHWVLIGAPLQPHSDATETEGAVYAFNISPLVSPDYYCAAGDIGCLKAAITAANGNGRADRIVLEAGTYVMTEPDDNGGRFGATGLPAVTSEIVIDGNGATIERSDARGTPDFRLLLLDSGGNLTLNNVAMRNGSATGERFAEDCGAIFQNDSSWLRIHQSVISGNRAQFIGGALCLNSEAVIRETTVSDNTGVDGGGIFLGRDGDLDLIDSVVNRNVATYGGGLFVDSGGIAHIVNSDISGNEASSWGGGIGTFAFGPYIDFGTSLNMSEVSVTNNTAGDGGGLYSSAGQSRLTGCLFSGNAANFGGGAITNRRAELTVTDSCVAGNLPAPTSGLAVANAPDAPEVDARHNWWGAADGPGGVGPGSGDPLGENIRFAPFRDSPASPCVEVPLENLGRFVSFDPDEGSFRTSSDTAGCQANTVGTFRFTATLANTSPIHLSDLHLAIQKLTSGNRLSTLQGPLGEGDVLRLPSPWGIGDGELAPGETKDVPFTICLASGRPFRFMVDVLGTVSEGSEP